jgi:addiction module HigA family antidote
MRQPPHPELSVRYDCLEPLGMTSNTAAAALGISRLELYHLLIGRRGLTPEMAEGLDRVFGGGAETWVRMQAAYDAAYPQPAHNYALDAARREGQERFNAWAIFGFIIYTVAMYAYYESL